MAAADERERALALAVVRHYRERASDAADALAAALGVNEATDGATLGVDKDLTAVFAAGLDKLGLSIGSGASAASTAADPVEQTATFKKYLEKVAEKGFFKGTEEGSPEYRARYEKLVAKYKEKFASQAAEPGTDEAAAEKANRFKEEGNQHLSAGKYEEAAKSYSNAIEACPSGANSHIYYCNRAAAYLYLEKHEEALEDCTVATTLDPSYAKAHARAAAASLKLGRKDDAKASAERALELDPANASAKATLAAAGGGSNVARGTGAGGDPFASLMAGMGGGAGGGMPDIGSLLNNPQMMQAAQAMMQNPQMQQMAQQMMSDPNAMADMMKMMGGFGGMGGGK